jgi:hypothetical protein
MARHSLIMPLPFQQDVRIVTESTRVSEFMDESLTLASCRASGVLELARTPDDEPQRRFTGANARNPQHLLVSRPTPVMRSALCIRLCVAPHPGTGALTGYARPELLIVNGQRGFLTHLHGGQPLASRVRLNGCGLSNRSPRLRSRSAAQHHAPEHEKEGRPGKAEHGFTTPDSWDTGQRIQAPLQRAPFRFIGPSAIKCPLAHPRVRTR